MYAPNVKEMTREEARIAEAAAHPLLACVVRSTAPMIAPDAGSWIGRPLAGAAEDGAPHRSGDKQPV
jgi:hypothetical protein